MTNNSYSFKVGHFECLAVSDGIFSLGHENMFTNATISQVEQLLHAHDIEPGEIAIQATYLLINMGQNFVLLDTGFGAGRKPGTGKLLDNLKAEGINPTEINTVILSHGHTDHIGGNTDDGGKTVFPNARYMISRKEWEFWSSEISKQKMLTTAQQNLLMIRKQNLLMIREQIEIVDYETEILPGIKTISAPGHTPGHMALIISSADEQLLCTFDIVHYPFQLARPDWHFFFDTIPEQAMQTRRKLLNRATIDKVLVWACHFPYPGLGYIVRDSETWSWQPTEVSK